MWKHVFSTSAAAAVLALLAWLIASSTPSMHDRGDQRLGTDLALTPASTSGLTYNERIFEILQRNCISCHRVGGGAPFPLQSYRDASSRTQLIRSALEQRRMPPWFAEPAPGRWSNDRTLAEVDRLAILEWIRIGAPEGVLHAAPPVPTPESGWDVGTPDAVLRIPAPVKIPATGTIPYQYLHLQTHFEEDRWITAMQVRPSAPEVVHHILVFVEDAPGPPRLGLDGFFAAYGPGNTGITFPPGHAKRLPRGARLRFQLHYTPNGTAVEDATELALVFRDGPPEHVVETGAIANANFRLLPWLDNQRVSAETMFSRPTRLLGFLPHMHLRGKAFAYEILHSDGRSESVLRVPRYSPHWQLEYLLNEPLTVPSGSRLRATGWFDNSARNPHNPDPNRFVPFGEQIFDEMMVGYFHYVVDGSERATPDSLGVGELSSSGADGDYGGRR
jgi:hypothetical protein